MKVKLRTTRAGPKGVHRQGDVIDLPQSEAEYLINTLAAVPWKPDMDTATMAVAENASLNRKAKRHVMQPRGE